MFGRIKVCRYVVPSAKSAERIRESTLRGREGDAGQFLSMKSFIIANIVGHEGDAKG